MRMSKNVSGRVNSVVELAGGETLMIWFILTELFNDDDEDAMDCVLYRCFGSHLLHLKSAMQLKDYYYYYFSNN